MLNTIRKRTPSDALPVLRWAVMLFTLLIIMLVAWAATGKRFSDEILLPSVVAAYGFADFSYSLLSTLLYRNRKREEKKEREENNGHSKRHPSYGELVGTGFVAVLFLVGLLVGFRVWMFKTMPDAAFYAIDVTVGIIVLASIAKKFSLPKAPRNRHNTALYFLSVYSTVIIVLLLINAALGGPELVDDYLWSYTIIVGGYTTHNVILSILRPGIPQKRYGHLVALGVVVFSVVIYILNAFDVVELPRFITPFFGITVFILGIGAGAKFMAKEPLLKAVFGTVDEESIKKHFDSDHDEEDMDDCNDCNHDNKEL